MVLLITGPRVRGHVPAVEGHLIDPDEPAVLVVEVVEDMLEPSPEGSQVQPLPVSVVDRNSSVGVMQL